MPLTANTQGCMLTYFETCPIGQVRVTFTGPNLKFTCPYFFVWYSLTGFSFPTTAFSIKEGSNFTCPVGVGSSVVQQVLSFVPGSRTILNVYP